MWIFPLLLIVLLVLLYRFSSLLLHMLRAVLMIFFSGCSFHVWNVHLVDDFLLSPESPLFCPALYPRGWPWMDCSFWPLPSLASKRPVNGKGVSSSSRFTHHPVSPWRAVGWPKLQFLSKTAANAPSYSHNFPGSWEHHPLPILWRPRLVLGCLTISCWFL